MLGLIVGIMLLALGQWHVMVSPMLRESSALRGMFNVPSAQGTAADERFEMIANGDGSFSFRTPQGGYLCAEPDGAVTLRCTHPEGRGSFGMLHKSGRKVALRTFYGKYLTAQKNGRLTATSTSVHGWEWFTLLKLDNSVAFKTFHGTVISTTNFAWGMVLLTSVFVSTEQYPSQHLREIYAALTTNLMHELIAEVHVLTESDCALVLALIEQTARLLPYSRPLSNLHKLVCKSLAAQPTYADFFRYASANLSGKVVILSNADVVFDNTLGHVELEPVLRGDIAHVLSVRPPPPTGLYHSIFGQACASAPRCMVGAWTSGGAWSQGDGAGTSWDAYVFSPPRSGKMNLSHVDVPMNVNGAANLAAFQLEVNGGIPLSNPCAHIRAYHWHCLGRPMHSLDPLIRVDRPPWYKAAMNMSSALPLLGLHLLPCWDCPGLKKLAGTGRDADLCARGVRQGASELPALGNVFREDAVRTEVCCSTADACATLHLASLPRCAGPRDLDCVIWETARGQHDDY
jgi:hypothetical protein